MGDRTAAGQSEDPTGWVLSSDTSTRGLCSPGSHTQANIRGYIKGCLRLVAKFLLALKRFCCFQFCCLVLLFLLPVNPPL